MEAVLRLRHWCVKPATVTLLSPQLLRKATLKFPLQDQWKVSCMVWTLVAKVHNEMRLAGTASPYSFLR